MRNRNHSILNVLFILLPCLLVQYLQADSWAAYERYEAANKVLLEKPFDENRVVFMGDSITDAWIHVSPDFWSKHPFIDRGISGQTTGQMVLRFRPDVIDLKPSVVVILAGTNDLAENQGPTTYERILGNLKSMAELAKANDIDVVLCTILPAKEYYWRPNLSPGVKIPEMNAFIREFCEKEGIPLIDYFAAMVNEVGDGMRKGLSEDEVHPNEKGYAIMEPLVLEVLQTLSDTRN